jgi:hypothetical protein
LLITSSVQYTESSSQLSKVYNNTGINRQQIELRLAVTWEDKNPAVIACTRGAKHPWESTDYRYTTTQESHESTITPDKN